MAGSEPLTRQGAIELALQTFGGNEIELQILLACLVEPTSPSDLADGRVTLARMAYFFGRMRNGKLVRVTRKEQVRGAVKTYHAITPKGRKVLAQLGLPEDDDASS